MRRETGNILLLLLGGALLKISLGGSYLNYVKPSQQPFLIAAGFIMVGLAVVSIVRDLVGSARPKPEARAVRFGADGQALPAADDAHDHDDHDGHEGHDHKTHTTWMLLLPVLAVFLIAPPALGADSVNRDEGRAVRQPAGQFAPLPGNEVISIKVSDFAARGAWDTTGTLVGKKVKMIGFVANRDGVPYLARMVIGCCAADAFAAKVKLEGQDLQGLRNDSWIEVVGQLRPGTATEHNGYVSTLDVIEVRPATAPGDPYES
ncbi:putative repeat protein (TIGR03943 family) [Herbihabitans rhizosphaerae]|uniref:Putative repeat protein (TIGR03943 family) n=1 Tax=Herbihabitans rhizosphaerae TaxID=1872711 RepID=A0A4Q7KBV6_9PSEU|nr:TIGR03943 family protein [Herbihabitans rhizosphaerae]RZS29634.1 putative repeat protein (TIGR03943 family) [Herbihabitans rhizosphaerae]